MLAASVGTLFAESGTCGATLTWDLTGGVLTISGTGAMTDYSASNHAPWNANRESITSVIIENGVTSIGEWAFYYCRSLTSVTIPNSVTSIGARAFYSCSSLTSLTSPNSVTSIGRYAFLNCSSLTSIDVASENPNYCSVDGVLFNKDKTELIQYPIGNARTEYTIPCSVTSIGERAFGGCSSLTSITIPNSVTSIGDAAFLDCSSLTSVTIPNSVTSIGEVAFQACSGLTSVTIPNSVTSIGYLAFASCSKLTSVTIPNSVTSIGNEAFSDCLSLTSINVAVDNPDYCSVDGVLFNKDKILIQYPIGNARTKYTIPNSVTGIGSSAFYNCSRLTSITIPNCVTGIGVWAFSECSSLTSVTIPNSVTSIESYTFYNCSSLTSITCEATTPPTCGDDVFENVPKTIPVYVPALSVDDYKAADGWKDFGENIQAIHATAVDQISNNQSQMTNKIIKDNQVLILRGEKTYTLTGQEVK